MDMATFLAIVGIILAIIVPVAVVLWVEALKRAHLEIVRSDWRPPNFVTWTFATVRVRNKPLGPRLGGSSWSISTTMSLSSDFKQ
jgi:hypothetical protein